MAVPRNSCAITGTALQLATESTYRQLFSLVGVEGFPHLLHHEGSNAA
jgi:hypothetical protein